MKKMHGNAKTALLRAGVFTALLLLAILLYSTAGIYYGINDDSTMQALASGAITGTPDGHLVFVSWLLGSVIAGLFRLLPGFDWYGITMIGLLLFSFSTAVCRILRRTAGRPFLRAAGLLVVLVILLDSLLLFQWTLVAGVLAAAALFCLVTAEDRIRTADYVLAWILLLLAALVRVKVFFMAAPLAAVITAGKTYRVLRDGTGQRKGLPGLAAGIREHRTLLLRLLALTALGVLLFAGTRLAEDKAYSSDRWKEYSKFKHARSMIMDYYGWPPYEGNEAFWESINVSKREYNCLYLFGLLPDIDAEKMALIAENAEAVEKQSADVPDRLSEMFALFVTGLVSRKSMFLHLLLAGLLVLLILRSRQSDKVSRLFIAAGVLTEVLALLYLLYQGRLPTRVAQIFDYQCILAAFGLLLMQPVTVRESRKRVFSVVCVCACLLAAALEGAEIGREITTKRYNISRYEIEQDYIRQHPDRVFCMGAGTVPSARQFMITDPDDAPSNTIGTSGWSIRSPWMDVKYENLGLDPRSDILMNENVYLISGKRRHADQLNSLYYNEKKIIDKRYKIIDTINFPDGRFVYVFKWQPREP